MKMTVNEIKLMVAQSNDEAYKKALWGVAQKALPVMDGSIEHTQDDVNSLLDTALIGQLYLDGALGGH